MTDPIPDLRARIRDALVTTPAARAMAATNATREASPFAVHGTGHNYDATCALCRGEADTLTDAVMAVIGQLEADVTTLAAVGDLYLRCLDDDPANEYLTLGAAIRVTDIREAVQRQGYDVRWQTDDADA